MRVDVKNVSYGVGDRLILDDVSLSFDRGIAALLGPNGAGKTTLLRLVSGYLAPSEGTVEIDGSPARAIPARERARKIAIVAQQEKLEYDFTVLDVVLMGRTPWKKPLEGENARDRQLAREALREAGIEDLADRSILSLSGGERQRTTIARAFCQQTPILLLDEPVSALDIRHQVGILSSVRRFALERGLLCLIVLHDLNLAARYADRIVLMQEGRVAMDGAPREVLKKDVLESVYRTSVRVLEDEGEMFVLPRMRR